MARVILSMLVSLMLPPLLVYRLMPAEYSAWVLILQTSAYINLLDLGLQTAVGKFVAEYDAAGNRRASSQTLSSSFVILCISALVGAIAIALVAWKVPVLFKQMPTPLFSEVRWGIILVGLSTVFALPFGAFSAVFTGLQRYGFPTALAIASRVLSAAALAILLLMHGSVIEMAGLIAAFNVVTALCQYLGWKKYAENSVGFSHTFIDRPSSVRLVKYGSVLSIWTVATLFVSGLDMIIVGHYDFKNTGYYGIASSATNFLLLIVGSVFGPLLPAVSSIQQGKSPVELGHLTIKVTRYCTLFLCLVGLPIILGAYPLLRLWVGNDYALRSAMFLQILIIGNAIRQLGYPYALVVVATGRQHLATLAGVAEAIVNLSLSIYLVQKVGAVGVAIGTLAGAFVSVGLHLTFSMKFTQATVSMARRNFILSGLLRPMACAVPSILILPFWVSLRLMPINIPLMFVWFFTTFGIAWFSGLTASERSKFKKISGRLIYWEGTENTLP